MKKLLLPLLCLSSIALVGCISAKSDECKCETISFDTDWQTLDFLNPNIYIDLDVYVNGYDYCYSSSSSSYIRVDYRFISYLTHSEMTVNLYNSYSQQPVKNYYAGTTISYKISSYNRV